VSVLLGTAHAKQKEFQIGETLSNIADSQLRATLLALAVRARQRGTGLEDEVAKWFDDSMDRLSGEYKRLTQWVSFAAAFLAAVLMNIDTIHITTTLWDRPVVAAAIASIVQAQGTGIGSRLADLLPLVQGDYPIGWSEPIPWAIWPIIAKLAGCLITASASLFGAPFWFDTLQRLVQLRGTGRAVGTIGPHSPS